MSLLDSVLVAAMMAVLGGVGAAVPNWSARSRSILLHLVALSLTSGFFSKKEEEEESPRRDDDRRGEVSLCPTTFAPECPTLRGSSIRLGSSSRPPCRRRHVVGKLGSTPNTLLGRSLSLWRSRPSTSV